MSLLITGLILIIAFKYTEAFLSIVLVLGALYLVFWVIVLAIMFPDWALGIFLVGVAIWYQRKLNKEKKSLRDKV